MQILQMRCPNCNAELKVDDGIESFYCQYCGTRIILDGQSDAVIRAKARLKTLDKVGDLQYEIHQQRKEMKAQKAAIRAAEEKRAMKIFAATFGGALLFVLLMLAIHGIMVNRENTRLNEIYAEIQVDIENGDYDSALIKANSLYFRRDDDDLKEQWDEMRESVIDIINSQSRRR